MCRIVRPPRILICRFRAFSALSSYHVGMRTPIALMLLAACCHAETYSFGEGKHAFEMEFVTIGAPGNANDTRVTPPMGAVNYEYQMAKTEVSCTMVAAASHAVAFDSPHGSCQDPGVEIPFLLSTVKTAQFVNWLNADQGLPPAYKINNNLLTDDLSRLDPWAPGEPGYNPENPVRNSRARFVIPTRDEWHKSAFYDPGEDAYRLYATGHIPPEQLGPEGGTEPNTANYQSNEYVDVRLAGGASAYGTIGQLGNVSEWEERFVDPEAFSGFSVPFVRHGIMHGGILSLRHTAERSRSTSVIDLEGLRVAAVTPVPEPTSLTLLTFALWSLGTFRRR